MLPVLGSLLLLLFAYLTWKDWPGIRDAWRSRKWKPTHARVVKMKDHWFEMDVAGKYSTATKKTIRETFYTFRYVVNHTTFHTKRFSFGGRMDQSDAQFSAGDSVTIYYNPAHPSEAVVQRGLSFSVLSAPLIGITLAAIMWWVSRH